MADAGSSVAAVSNDVAVSAPTMSITWATPTMLPEVAVGIGVLLSNRKTCPPAAAIWKVNGPASCVGSAVPLAPAAPIWIR